MVHLVTCHVMPFLASSGHNWGAGVVMICTIPCIFYSWDRENYIFPKVTKVESILSHRIDYQYNGYRFWETSGTYPAKIKPPPPPPPNLVNFSNKFASCQLDLFVITLCLIWKVGKVFSNGSDKNVRWQESAHPGRGGIKLTLPFGAP